MSGSLRHFVLVCVGAVSMSWGAGPFGVDLPAALGQADPTEETSRRNPFAALLHQDGQTIVIGGLGRSEKTQWVNQVPILGDLPLIGLLFRSTTTVTTRSELVVLLSPHICKDEPISAAILAERDRIREMSLLSQHNGGSGGDGAGETPGEDLDP